MDSGEKIDTAHTVFGKAYGVGVAHYLVHQDKDLALYALWLAYFPHIENDKKTLAKCLNALQSAFYALDDILVDHKVVTFNGKPAVELSFLIDIDDDYYFVGYLDVALENIYTGQRVVLDAKTTGLNLENLAPLYKQSGQLLGYSIILDAIFGEASADYNVKYLVCQTGQGFTPKTHVLTYEKTLLDRLHWFLSLSTDVERLHRMKELNIYPKRGSSCLHFNSPCTYFNICDLHAMDVKKVKTEDVIEYDFYFDLQTLIKDHIRRVGHV